ncbi:DUF2125 domain-containing protein [Roseicella sp. DB1501]|uniref:DUF2125 domain-containing protein n=1 Tax=Roseicella sp. DB1501 TaxID=2730925 RepID=UPI001491F51B|nr:DUF2125 domain-containing protein [Roseicella sp. DB1501]NOG71357.1 DUF2125 domain-containing protein [Roseicella sp. DB1501]
MSLKPFLSDRRPRRSGSLPARLLRGLLRVALVLALLHALVWRWAVGELETQFEAWAAQRRSEGWLVTYDAPERGGWPFAATLFLPWTRLGGAEDLVPGGVEWQAEGVRLRLSPLQPRRLTLELLGWQRVFGESFDLHVTADRFTAELPLAAGDSLRELPLAARRLRLRSPAGLVEAERLGLHLDLPPGPAGETGARLGLAVSGLQLPPGLGQATEVLGRTMQALHLDLALSGPLPMAGTLAARAAAWREAGGALEAHDLALRWGPLTAQGSARLGLDRALQPRGEAALQVTGADALLRAAAGAGLLTQQAALAGQALIGLLGRRPAEGGPPVLDLPLALEGRVLSAARLRLGVLPEWRWPGQAVPARN